MSDETQEVRAGMTETEMRSNLLRLVFGGDPHRLEVFCKEVESALPPDAAAVIRGSSVTGVRAEDGAPFDADGPGSSDVDLTFVGASVLDWFTSGGFYVNPPNELHSLSIEEESVLQLTCEGPWEVNYVK